MGELTRGVAMGEIAGCKCDMDSSIPHVVSASQTLSTFISDVDASCESRPLRWNCQPCVVTGEMG